MFWYVVPIKSGNPGGGMGAKIITTVFAPSQFLTLYDFLIVDRNW
jgi:hypothetical protein